VFYDERVFSNVLDIVAYVGGLEVFIFFFCSKMGEFINSRKLHTKFIRNLYFHSSEGNKISSYFFKSC